MPRVRVAAAPEESTAPMHAPYGSPLFESRLDQLTGSTLRPGNKVELLFDGDRAHAERVRLIDGAQSSVCLQAFRLLSDVAGWELARSLAAKAGQGVAVRVLYDAVGSARSAPGLFEYLESRGVKLRAFGDALQSEWEPFERWCENHLVVDAEVALEGGGGAGPGLCAEARVEGPLVQDAQQAFLKNWSTLGDEPPPGPRAAAEKAPEKTPGKVSGRVISQRPDQEGEPAVEAALVEAVHAAQHRVCLAGSGFAPPLAVREALCEAALRGVDVRAAFAASGQGLAPDSVRYFFADLVAAGVRLYEVLDQGFGLRGASFDGELCFALSADLNARTRGRASASALAIADAASAVAFESRFHGALAESRELSAAELRDESFTQNLRRWAVQLLAETF